MKKWRNIVLGVFIVILVLSCASKNKKTNPFANYPKTLLEVYRVHVVRRTQNALVPRNVTFIYVPSADIVRFHHKFMSDNIWVSLDKENRKALVTAMETYIDEYTNKKLTVENDKKKGYFGKTRAAMYWGPFGASHSAKPTLRFEYQYITPQRPYFIIGNAMKVASDSSDSRSPAMRIAFSPDQCKDIIEVIKEESLSKVLEELRTDYERFEIADEGFLDDLSKKAEKTDDPASIEDTPF